MTPELNNRIVARLLDSDIADGPSALIILPTLEGSDHLEAHLEGKSHVEKPKVPPVANAPGQESPGAYVASITVEGFRGVGPSVTLPLRPGPGLTLVVGRNGSGK